MSMPHQERMEICKKTGKLAKFVKLSGDTEERCCFWTECGHECKPESFPERKKKEKN